MEEIQVNAGGSIQNSLEAQSKMNFFQRLIGIIVSPSKTFKDLIAKPRILFPFLLSTFSILVFYLLRYDLYQEYVRKTLENAIASDPSVTAEQAESLVVISTTAGLISAPITAIIIWLVSSAILFGIAKLLKGEGSFKQYLSIVGYSSVITALYYVLSIVMSYFTGELMLDASLANVTNLFAPHLKGTYLYGIIRGIDLFNIWYFALVGYGIILLSKMSKVKGYTMVTVIFIIQLLINAMELKYY